jgi:hypothetical protein
MNHADTPVNRWPGHQIFAGNLLAWRGNIMKKYILSSATALSLAALATPSIASAATEVSLEAPRVQNTTKAIPGITETFEGTNTGRFGGDFGTNGANTYGGAFGGGRYAFTNSTLAVTGFNPANFFGVWVSALNAQNGIRFFSDNNVVFEGNLVNLFQQAGGNSAYFGNPNPNFLGQNSGEPYAYFNFLTDATFNRVELYGYNGTLEIDNVTIGNSVNALTAVPEPATWAMMILGMGAVGFAMRRRRATRAVVCYA